MITLKNIIHCNQLRLLIKITPSLAYSLDPKHKKIILLPPDIA